jgi:hypothetical protein
MAIELAQDDSGNINLECGGMTPLCLCRQHVAGYESDIVMSHSK